MSKIGIENHPLFLIIGQYIAPEHFGLWAAVYFAIAAANLLSGFRDKLAAGA